MFEFYFYFPVISWVTTVIEDGSAFEGMERMEIE